MLIQRIGRERVLGEAIDSHIGGWFWRAAESRRGLRPVAQPEYDYELPERRRAVDVHRHRSRPGEPRRFPDWP